MRKQAISPALKRLLQPTIAKSLAAGAVGIPAGAAFGKYVTPKLFGYEGDKPTTNLSMLIDAGLFAALFGMPFHPKTPDLLSRIGPRIFPLAATAAGTSELIPIAMNTLREATAKKTTYDKVVDALKSPAARGAGVGAATAALAGLGSGMLRAPSTAEQSAGDTRAEMSIRDMLKFLLPAMVTGGVGGHLMGKRSPQQGAGGPSAVAGS